MAQSMTGMFGLDPAEYDLQRQARNRQMAGDIFDKGPMYGASLLGMNAIDKFGDAAGIKDKTQQRGETIKGIVDELRQEGIDMTEPEKFYPAMIKKLSEAGLNNEANAMAEKFRSEALEGGLKLAQTNKTNAEALKAMREKEPELVRLQTALKEAIARGDNEAALEIKEQIIKVSMDTKELEEGTPDGKKQKNMYTKDGRLIRAGTPYEQKPLVDMSTKGGFKVIETINTEGAKGLQQKASYYANLAPHLKDLEKLAKTDNLDTGFGANWITESKRVLLRAGILKKGQEATIRNNEVLRMYAMELVLPKMKELGGSDSNEELRKLSEAVANPNMTLETFKSVIRTYKRESKRWTKKWNKFLQDAEKDGGEGLGKKVYNWHDFGDIDKETETELEAEGWPNLVGTDKTYGDSQPPAPPRVSPYKGAVTTLDEYRALLLKNKVPPPLIEEYVEKARKRGIK